MEGVVALSKLTPTRSADFDAVVEAAADPLQRLAGRRLLIAGAAGFLPSCVVGAVARANDVLLDEPCEIVCVDNYSSGLPERIAHLTGRSDVQPVNADVSVLEDPGGPIDHVLHGASIASPTWYRRFPLETIDANVGGTRNLLDLAVGRKARTFVYLSSSEIYGDPPPEKVPTTEDYWGHVSSIGPRACYDESKRLAETLAMTYQRVHGLAVRLARPFNVYGPGLRLDDGRIIPDLLAAVLSNRPLVLHSDGRATRSFCYVADAAAALLHLLVDEVDDGPYNVGNPDEVQISEVAAAVSALAGGLRVEHQASDDAEYLTDNPQRRCPDIAKIVAATGWKPTVGLREGLARTLAHYSEEMSA